MYFSSFGYSHYLHNEVFAPRGIQWIWLDVICQYWQWAKNKSTIFPESQAMAMKPALSVMHAKAHLWACEVCACLQCYSVCMRDIFCFSQILWGGSWQVGTGAGAGEDMEQLFSYLSHLGVTTKNNTAAGSYLHMHCVQFACSEHINKYDGNHGH